MEDFFVLDEKYSTTRNLFKDNNSGFYSSRLDHSISSGKKIEGGLRREGFLKRDVKDKPLVTVVTVVYNGESFLENTILSVLNQDYDNVEYIIIDGGSSDGTLDIIRKYNSAIDYWLSEKDNGIYFAMNKGIENARGKWINFMNGGDKFASNNVLIDVFSKENDCDINLIFGKSITFYKDYEKVRYLNFNSEDPDFYYSRMPNHQAVFIRSDIYKKVFYDVSYKYFSDTDYLRRCFRGATFKEESIVISRFELGGISNYFKSIRNCYVMYTESCRLSGKKISPFIKFFSKFFLQKILGEEKYLIFYINRILK